MPIRYLKKENRRAVRVPRTIGQAALLSLMLGVGLGATGCGPGFPIMTSEQELLVNNVNSLMDRVATIEESGAAGADLEETRLSLADSKAEMERIRDEFTFIRGSFEENEIAIAQLKADSESAEARITSVSEQFAAIEAELKRLTEQVSALNASAEADAFLHTNLGSTVSELKKRIDTLEQSVQSSLDKQKSKEATAKATAKKSVKSSKEIPTPKYLYAKGLKETKAKEYRAAAKTFKTFLSTHPSHDLADNAQYWLGEIFYDTGEYERAILEFNKVITDYPKGDKRPAATLKQGFSFEKLGAAKEARVLLETVVELYPKSDEAVKATKRLEKLTKKKKPATKNR
ncbi:MAG: tol-pal system protein YbgF [Proteobacteria bacterium]|nr:tol-pal system protein YbgF [Pseudomonadota bacterium]